MDAAKYHGESFMQTRSGNLLEGRGTEGRADEFETATQRGKSM
jgi:hypothetical protein